MEVKSNTIIITGATGFIGRNLSKTLIEDGCNVIAVSRSPEKASAILGPDIKCLSWDIESLRGAQDVINNDYAVINLAGDNLSSGRWTKNKKRRILESRLNAGKSIIKLAEILKKAPRLIIQASAIGYYGISGDDTVTEDSPVGSGFLSDVVQKWEDSIKSRVVSDTRNIFMRTGLVLGKDGGILKKVIIPFRFFAGGHIGNGKQWYSWIHISDFIDAVKFFLKKDSTEGIYNLTSPNPLPAKEFFKVLGQVLNRPSWFHVPGFLLKILFGEMADEVLLSGKKVMPERLVKSGFEFRFFDLEPALKDILV